MFSIAYLGNKQYFSHLIVFSVLIGFKLVTFSSNYRTPSLMTKPQYSSYSSPCIF